MRKKYKMQRSLRLAKRRSKSVKYYSKDAHFEIADSRIRCWPRRIFFAAQQQQQQQQHQMNAMKRHCWRTSRHHTWHASSCYRAGRSYCWWHRVSLYTCRRPTWTRHFKSSLKAELLSSIAVTYNVNRTDEPNSQLTSSNYYYTNRICQMAVELRYFLQCNLPAPLHVSGAVWSLIRTICDYNMRYFT